MAGSEPATPRPWKTRDVSLSSEMTATEAAMWRVGSDPWLDPSGSMISILDVEPDMARLRTRLADGVTSIPRMVERVVESRRPLGLPRWEPDPEFDPDDHVIELAVPSPGSHRQLLDLAQRLHTDPLDPNRPPWRFWLISGLEGGRAAMVTKMHHSIADGIGSLRMAELYLDLERDPGPVEPRPAAATAAAAGSGDQDEGDSLVDMVVDAVSRPLQLARTIAGEAALLGADPLRAADGVNAVRSTLAQFIGDDGGESGSPLWRQRSRRRHLCTADAPLAEAKQAARAWGGTVNDLFVTAVAEAAAAHHVAAGVDVPALAMTFVRSTRTGDGAGANAFTPVRILAPPGDCTAHERFEHLRDAMAAQKQGDGGISLASLAGAAAYLPASATSRLARDQARRIDIATSNIRSAPFPVYIGGAMVEACYPIGPVAGTAVNTTVVSYNGRLYVGAMIDPVAIADADGFGERIQTALDAIIADATS